MTPLTELRNRKLEQQRSIREGMASVSRRRLEQLQQNIQEQRKLRDMLDKYYPWGKPGGGAPNENITRSNIRTNELIPDDEKRTRFGLCPKYVSRNRSPRSYYQHPTNPTIREDPALRFQMGDTVRPEIENKFRYRTSRQQQDFYRRQLDAIVAEQKKSRAKLDKENLDYAKQLDRFGAPWGKVGPDGYPWRPPPEIGSNFFKSMGWTTEKILQEIENNNFLSKSKKELEKLPKISKTLPKITQKELEKENKDCRICNNPNKNKSNDENDPDSQRQSTGELTGGIELVPLLAKRRAAAVRLPLCSTDVTRIPECPKFWTYNGGPEYLEELSTQVKQRHKQLLESQQNDKDASLLHFETWDAFWGRPGNGAPISDDHHKKRLDELLYYKPIKCHNV